MSTYSGNLLEPSEAMLPDYARVHSRPGSSAVTSDGKVWLGTSERALVFRFDPTKNEARAMADFAGNEVSSLAQRSSDSTS
mgnify:CR=1 FL=1